MEIRINDLLMITQNTVDLYVNSRWATHFQQKHIGEQVRYGGEYPNYKEFGSIHILAFQSGRGSWHTPNCPFDIIMIMRLAYLDSLENEHA